MSYKQSYRFNPRKKYTDKRVTSMQKKHSTMLSTRLWSLRFASRLTQTELAERAGVSRKTIHCIEQGKTLPTLMVAMKIAAALGVDTDMLFALEDRQL